METIQENIKIICENLSDDLVNKWDKDKAMVLNNLCEYILPKKQRIGHETNVSESRDFIIHYYEGKANRGTKTTNGEASQEA